jgi:hypothetical protein
MRVEGVRRKSGEARLHKGLPQPEGLALQHAAGLQARERGQVVRREQQVRPARLPHQQARDRRARARRAVRQPADHLRVRVGFLVRMHVCRVWCAP